MKNNAKKVVRNFRVDANLNEELVAKSQLSGMNQTAILHDALRFYFDHGLRLRLESAARKMPKGKPLSFSSPAMAEAA